MPKGADQKPAGVTQQDIARMACVSQATVSRVLAGDTRVESTIRDRVSAVIKEHNYRPDVRARSLRKQLTGLVGLVVKRPTPNLAEEPFIADLIAGIMTQLAGTGYHLCLDFATSEVGQAAVYDEMLRTRRVDGLILVESEACDDRVRLLQEDRFPFVLVGNPMEHEEIVSVDNDNVDGGYVATRHLLSQGYRRVGIIAGPQGLTVSEDRITGYRRAVREFGQDSRIWYSEFGSTAARVLAEELLERPKAPDALVVLDDNMALGVILAAKTVGKRIPEDLGVVGFNDSSLCDLLDGGLTSVSLNIPLIASHATERLLQTIQGQPIDGPKRLIVPIELHVRGSSARPQGAAL